MLASQGAANSGAGIRYVMDVMIAGPRRWANDGIERQEPYRSGLYARLTKPSVPLAKGHENELREQGGARHTACSPSLWVLLVVCLSLGACGESTPREPQSKVPAEDAQIAVVPQLNGDPTPEARSPDSPAESAGTDSSAPTALGHYGLPVSPSSASFLIETTRDLSSLDPKVLESGGELAIPLLLLTADISNVPLRTVLSELGRKLAVKVFVAEAVGEAGITVKFERLPVEEGIEKILQGQNYTLIRKRVREPAAVKGREGETMIEGTRLVIAEIRLLAREGQAAELTELDLSKPNDPEVAALAERALKGEKPEERLAALKGFVERADRSQLTATLTPALKDKDGKMRQLALESIDSADDPPFEPIAEVALQDESPELRITAYQGLVAIHGAAAALPILEQALADPDPVVRQAAENTLKMHSEAATR